MPTAAAAGWTDPPSGLSLRAALRVISDPAHRALPELAQSAIKPNGDIDMRTIVRGVVRNPKTLSALVSTGIDFNRALRSLRGCRHGCCPARSR